MMNQYNHFRANVIADGHQHEILKAAEEVRQIRMARGEYTLRRRMGRLLMSAGAALAR